MNLALVFIVVIAIMTMFAIIAIWVARKYNFSTKQTIDPTPIDLKNKRIEK